MEFIKTHDAYRDKIFAFDVQLDDEHDKYERRYQVATGLAGFVNHYTGRLRRPNAKVILRPEHGLTDGLLMMFPGLPRHAHRLPLRHVFVASDSVYQQLRRAEKQIPKNTEIVLDYGCVWFTTEPMPQPKKRSKRKAGLRVQ